MGRDTAINSHISVIRTDNNTCNCVPIQKVSPSCQPILIFKKGESYECQQVNTPTFFSFYPD